MLRPEDRAIALRLDRLGGFEGEAFGVPGAVSGAICGQRAGETAGAARGADGRAQVHHRLREIAGTRVGRDRVGCRAQFGHCSGERPFNREQPRHHARDIGIDHDRAFPKGDRGDRGGGVRADAGEFAQARFGRGEAAARDHGTRAGMEIARAGVVTKPRPGRHQIGLGCRRQRLDARPARDEFGEARRDRGDGGLLEHDLGQPHAVGVGRVTARRGAPRQRARVPIVPSEQSVGCFGGDFGWALGGHAPPMAWTAR